MKTTRRIAKQALAQRGERKLAKQIQAGLPQFRQRKSSEPLGGYLNSQLGNVFDMLYKLDIHLSNSFHGDKGEHDQAVTNIRKRLSDIMAELSPTKLGKDIRQLEG